MYFKVKSNIYYIYKKWKDIHIYYLYLVTITNIKMTVLLCSCHRSDEWQVRLIKIIYNINK